jgi:hypothetical protein
LSPICTGRDDTEVLVIWPKLALLTVVHAGAG